MVNINQFFPIFLPYRDHGSWFGNPYGFDKIFQEVRVKDKVWSTYSVEIRSPTEITFKVYLTNNWRDRRLEPQYDLDVTLDTEEELAVVRDYIEGRANDFARGIREQELLAQEELIISNYADSILRDLNLK